MSAPVLAVMACHNRRDRTVRAISSLHRNEAVPRIVVVDDGSTDGTAEVISDEYPDVELMRGDGNLFWGGGMNRGIERFLRGDEDYLLWLNDDVDLYANSLDKALEFGAREGVDVVVGQCVGASGEVTYGGRVRNGRFKPTSFRLANDGERPDTFNGNFVLFRRRVVEKIGPVDSAFPQSMGDWDYGLRAGAAGFSIGLLPGAIGVCERNPEAGSFLDPSVPRRQRLEAMLGIKGMPPIPWTKFCFRHAGWLAPIAILKPYLNVLLKR